MARCECPSPCGTTHCCLTLGRTEEELAAGQGNRLFDGPCARADEHEIPPANDGK
jgi:hypothetical protein